MSVSTIDIILLAVQILLLAAVIVAVSAMYAQRSRRRDQFENVSERIEHIEQGLDNKLSGVRQELETKIGQVGENVVDWLGKQNQAFIENIDKMRTTVDQTLATGRKELDDRLKVVSDQISQRLQSNIDVIQKANRDFSDRIDASTKVFAEVKEGLGKIEEAILADFLQQYLPAENYELQYAFSDGQKVDAVIKLTDGLVPIDAKFPLENFRRLISSKEGEDIEKGAKVRFRNDVKKHIDDIAAKYIRPAEGTFDFALMYVPAENVYYEIITAEFEGGRSLSDYACSKGVHPASPNNFSAFVKTIAIGLKGMKLEESIKDVLAKLTQMSSEMGGVIESYQVLGAHIRHASGKYDETEKKLDRFSSSLQSLTATTEKDQLTTDTSDTKALTD
jgi:DNA recombination protein RmuC